MARYQRLFDAFGPTAIGQITAATVIGGLIGLVASRKMEPNSGVSTGWIVAGGAALGFVVGLCLSMVDIRRKQVAAGTAKPRGPLFWVVLGLIVGFVFLAGCITFVIR